MQPVFNRYTVEEIRKIIEEYSECGLENEEDEIEIEIDNDNERGYFCFTVTNVNEGTWIGRYTIWKTKKNQEFLYSTIKLIEGTLHEVIECSRIGDLDLNHFVYIDEALGAEDVQSFLDSLETNKQEGRISHEEYEQSKKEIRILRLQTLF